MQRMARVSARIAQIQHDNLLYVYNFVDRERIRMMIMEWIDGYDLARLLVRACSNGCGTGERPPLGISQPGRRHARPSAATDESGGGGGDCAGLPSRGWRPCTGTASCMATSSRRTSCSSGRASTKIVDFGSAFEIAHPPAGLACTLAYAAPEVLERKECSSRSDLCSLGYVLIELLSGRPPFNGIKDAKELLEAKRLLPHRLHEILPQEVLGASS